MRAEELMFWTLLAIVAAAAVDLILSVLRVRRPWATRADFGDTEQEHRRGR
jgi:hypothetical protein